MNLSMSWQYALTLDKPLNKKKSQNLFLLLNRK